MNYITEIIMIGENEYTFFVGKNANGNEEIIKMSNPDDLWFHFENISGPHLILKVEFDIPLNIIKKIGRLLYSYKNVSKTESIIYTKVKNIKLTDELGAVISKNIKFI